MAHFIITTKPYVRADGTCQIIVRYTNKGKQYPQKIPNMFCKPGELDPNTQLINKGYKRAIMMGMNKRLMEIEARGNKILMELVDPDEKLFFKRLFEEPKEEAKKKFDDLVEIYRHWATYLMASREYKVTIPMLEEFKYWRGGLNVSDYSKSLLSEFENFLLDYTYIPSMKKKPIHLKHLYIKKHLSQFKYFGRYLTEEEMPIKQNFRDYRFSIKSPSIPNTLALTKKEFDELFYYDLSDNHILNLTKTIFIIGTAMGGIRISDLKELGTHSFNMESFTVSFTQRKTGGNVNNPLSEGYIRPHIDYFLDNINEIPCPQEFNLRMKEVANRVGWQRTEYINEYRGKSRRPERKMIWIKDYISSKFMRKTFISIMVELGYSKEIIKGFTGHVSDNAINHYIQIHQHSKRGAIEGFTPERPS